LIQGDITDQTTDAIVNAANSELILGAGVAGAIKTKGGPTIQEECYKLGGTPVGTAVITNAGKLPAKKVIHAVGPIWGLQSDDQSKKLLASAVRKSLQLILDNDLHSITFPAISTGVYGFPKALAAQIIIHEIIEFLESLARTSIDPLLIQICLFGDEDFMIFADELNKQLRSKRE
jgi:O-acetyl-ADP-ribose deacetylase (regulator of RNase III)